MSEILQWFTGLHKCKKHTLSNNNFTTEIIESDFESGRSIDTIFYDHLANRQTSKIEIMFSGGADSEFVLKSCIRNNIPLDVITMVIQIKGITLNAMDLYYSEKFCRENDIKQHLFYLDAEELYSSGKYLEYLVPFNITEPHVASHFWLIEQCNNYPVFGGDWLWFQRYRKVLSPMRLSYTCYENFMQSKGIDGIGNMIGHSFESIYRFTELHTQTVEDIIPLLKQKIFKTNPPRLRSYGWENIPKNILNMHQLKEELIKKIGYTKHTIVWGERIKTLIESDTNSNSIF